MKIECPCQHIVQPPDCSVCLRETRNSNLNALSAHMATSLVPRLLVDREKNESSIHSLYKKSLEIGNCRDIRTTVESEQILTAIPFLTNGGVLTSPVPGTSDIRLKTIHVASF